MHGVRSTNTTWCTDTALAEIKRKYGDQTDNCHYNITAVDNSWHSLIIHTIRNAVIAMFEEQVGGIRTL